MINIKDLISIHNPKDASAFIRHLESRNKRHDTRNVALYKAYLKGNEKTVLNEIGSNAFNALKKRLTDQLIEFLSNSFLANELSSENKVIKHIVIARKLFAADYIHTGYTILKRAEKLARGLDHYSMLNEIYHTMIEHSYKVDNLEQNVLFEKLRENNDRFIAEERLSVLYASMQKQFNSSNHGVLPSSLHEMYNQGLDSFGIKPELALNFRSLNQLCVLTDLYGSQTKNYHQLDLFFEEMISVLQGGEKDTEKMLGYHIELLYGMSNIYFRKKNAAKSIYYLEQMKAQMNRLNAKYKRRWNGRSVNLYALNLNYSSQFLQAIDLIEECLAKTELKETEKALLNLTLSMIHFQQGDLSEVKKIIGSFHKTDHWYLKQMGNEWLFNLKAMEVLLHVDLGNDQLAESRILSFQRKYAVHFRNDKDNPLWPFLNLVKSILFHSEYLYTEAFNAEVEKSIPWKGEKEDFFNMCFYSWLKAKMLKQPVYETTLELLNF